jgi:hypothetical protein
MKARAAIVLGIVTLAAAPIASAQNLHRIGTNLIGYQEVPAISTVGNGTFDATISQDETQLTYTLSYADMESTVTQAHIHFGQLSVNGGISIWLCGNASATINPPAGTPVCPPSPATVTRTVTAADVVGPAGQGIAATQFAEVLRAIRAGATYANVHTTTFPGGEIRGQLDAGHSH